MCVGRTIAYLQHSHRRKLNNPDMNVRRKDKVVTMRERLNHILNHDARFKNLKHEKKGNILADVFYDGNFLNSQSKNALFKKARDELRETHFEATFLLEELDKSGAKTITGAELLRRVDKKGEERRSGAAIDKKFYGSVIPSRGQLSSISAQVNRRANDIIAIEQISTASGEGWKYADFSAMVRVMLTAFKLTGTAKERRIKIGIALDAAPLTKRFLFLQFLSLRQIPTILTR
jgi:hypothetical protein